MAKKLVQSSGNDTGFRFTLSLGSMMGVCEIESEASEELDKVHAQYPQGRAVWSDETLYLELRRVVR